MRGEARRAESRSINPLGLWPKRESMATILVIWTLVGYAGTQFSTWEKYDWRPIGDFESRKACERAAADLGLKAERFRCISKREGFGS